MEQCFETSAYKIQTLGNYPKAYNKTNLAPSRTKHSYSLYLEHIKVRLWNANTSLRPGSVHKLGLFGRFYWNHIPGNEISRFIFRIQILKVKVSVRKPWRCTGGAGVKPHSFSTLALFTNKRYTSHPALVLVEYEGARAQEPVWTFLKNKTEATCSPFSSLITILTDSCPGCRGLRPTGGPEEATVGTGHFNP